MRESGTGIRIQVAELMFLDSPGVHHMVLPLPSDAQMLFRRALFSETQLSQAAGGFATSIQGGQGSRG